MSFLDEPIIEKIEVNGFVKIAVLFAVGVVILGGLVAGTQPSKSYTLSFTQNPSAGEYIQLNEKIFEFTNNGQVASGHIPVMIGTTLTDSVSNLESAIHSNTYLIIS